MKYLFYPLVNGEIFFTHIKFNWEGNLSAVTVGTQIHVSLSGRPIWQNRIGFEKE